MRTFVMGDIHGAHKALLQCLELAGFNKKEDQLIQLGDVVDGFPESFECVAALLSLDHLISIRGNHDDFFREFIATGFHTTSFGSGAMATAESYVRNCCPGKSNRSTTYVHGLEPSDIPATHKDFFLSQVLHFADNKNRFFVHAGFKRELPLELQRNNDFFWDRMLWHDAVHLPASDWKLTESYARIFLGHTPTLKYGSEQPMFAKNVINVDTGAGSNGRLTIMDVDTLEYWQSDLVTEWYPR